MGSAAWKLAFITGGSSGIGLATARQLLEQGTDVVLLARSRDRLEKAAAELALTAAESRTIGFFQVDVSDPEAVEDISHKAVKQYGRPDLLVSCAGMAYPDHFFHMPKEKITESIAINLTGTMLFVHSLLPVMRMPGNVILVSSVAGCLGMYGYTAYSASKFGVIGFAQSLRNELSAEGLSVSVVCPPDTQTPQLAQEAETKPPETEAISGSIKPMRPEKVAAQMLCGARRRTFMVIPGTEAKLVCTISRLFPAVVRLFLDRTVRSSRRRLGIKKRLQL
ncbi:MAG: SDR family oxidoreductase [Spirochaetota bacterium]